MTDDLHTRLVAAVNARLEVAGAAAAAKPGNWRVVATHVGGAYDGFSRVLAEEQTATGRITRFVAHNIADSLNVQRSSLDEDPPHPAVVAVYIALHDPITVIQHCKRDLRVLERHQPGNFVGCMVCRDAHMRNGICADLRDLATAYGMEVDHA